MDFKDIPELAKLIPGALGSLFSMFWIRNHWLRMFGMFFGGVVLSYYATDYVVKLTGFPGGLAGFLLGIFGMSIVASIFDGWGKLKLHEIFNEFLRARLKLPPPAKDTQS